MCAVPCKQTPLSVNRWLGTGEPVLPANEPRDTGESKPAFPPCRSPSARLMGFANFKPEKKGKKKIFSSRPFRWRLPFGWLSKME